MVRDLFGVDLAMLWRGDTSPFGANFEPRLEVPQKCKNPPTEGKCHAILARLPRRVVKLGPALALGQIGTQGQDAHLHLLALSGLWLRSRAVFLTLKIQKSSWGSAQTDSTIESGVKNGADSMG